MSRSTRMLWLRVGSAVGLLLAPSHLLGFELGLHGRMTLEAVRRSVIPEALRDLGLDPERALSGGLLRRPRSPAAWLLKGALDEDDAFSANLLRFRHHFYDPVNDRGLTAPGASGERAPDWALEDEREFPSQAFSYRDAREALFTALTAAGPDEREIALARTFEALGHVIHLVQDVASPQHTRNDIHAGVPGFGAKSLFEEYLDAIVDCLSFDASPIALGRPRQYWVTGDGRGLAEFTNRSFVSEGTNFSTRNDGAIGGGYPSPVLRLGMDEQGRSFETPLDIQTQLDPGLRDRKGNLIQGSVTFFANNFQDAMTGQALRNDWMTTLSLFDRDLERKGRAPVFTLNRYNIEAQASFLVPRAVGYSAGLLDYFFRGRLEFDLLPGDGDASLAKLVGFNRSDAVLGTSGQLTLAWEDVAGQRRPVEGPAPTLAATVEKNGALPELTFRWPDGAQRFVLAYRGPLGLEADAVVGKVAENPALEQIYWNAVPENDRSVFPWFLRTAQGVFVLPLDDFLAPGQTAEDVRWGERDNTLVVRTFDQGNDFLTDTAFVVFGLDRAEGASTVPTTGEVRYGRPVARIAPRQVPAATVPLHALANLDLGTTVTVRHTHTTRQFVASYEHRVSPTETTVSPAVVELLGTSVEPYAETFGLRVDRAHYRAACGEISCPHYSWGWEDFALTAAGDVLLLVTLREGALPDAQREIPALGYQPNGTVGPVGSTIVVPFRFPSDSHFVDDHGKLRGVAWVNLSRGTVLAKTMDDSVTLAQTTEQDLMLQQVHDIVENDAGETVLDEWIVVLPQPCPDPGIDSVSVERRQGVLSLVYDGLYRRELRDLELERDFVIRSSTSNTFFCFARSGLRVTTVTSGPDPFPYTITNFTLDSRQVSPGGQALARFPLVFTRRSGEDSQLVLWDALAASARRLLRAPGPDALGMAMANQRWALVDHDPHVHLVALDGSGTFDFPSVDRFGREFGDVYTLVAPDWLYNAMDDKFHVVVGQELTPTRMPDSLAPVDPADDAWVNAPFWPYHVIRPR